MRRWFLILGLTLSLAMTGCGKDEADAAKASATKKKRKKSRKRRKRSKSAAKANSKADPKTKADSKADPKAKAKGADVAKAKAGAVAKAAEGVKAAPAKAADKAAADKAAADKAAGNKAQANKAEAKAPAAVVKAPAKVVPNGRPAELKAKDPAPPPAAPEPAEAAAAREAAAAAMAAALAREKKPEAAPVANGPAAHEPALDITGFLTAVDLERVLGKRWRFQRSDLAGVTPSRTSNAVYFVPKKGADFGVSLQIWRDSNLVDSRTRFNTLKNTYTDVVSTNRVTEQGFRAHYGGVVSLVFADPRKPLVAAVSCSTKICKADKLIELSRRVSERMR